MISKDQRLLTTNQVAKRCGVKGRTVARWIRDGELPAIKLHGRTWRVREVDLNEFIEAQRTQPG